jgi:hypothetical protein
MGRATRSIGPSILADRNFKASKAQCVLDVAIILACTVPILGCMARDSFIFRAWVFPELVCYIFSSGIFIIWDSYQSSPGCRGIQTRTGY